MPHHTTALTLALLISPAAAAAGPRIVAVGDLHGDVANTLSVLQMVSLVDGSGRWIGGDAVFVQTGDTTDRGPDSRAVMDVMRRLQTEAAAAGGRVIPLLGNHEVMNLAGDWRYVNPLDVEAFGGAAARAEALSVTGEYGKWLRARDVVAVVEGTAFVHGGVTPRWASLGVDGINDAARTAILDGAPSILGPDGPLWYRGLVEDPESTACVELSQSLATLGATRMVVGHTTRRDGKVQVRCKGELLIIDTGIASSYGGNLSAVELTNGDARAVYPTGPVDLEDPTP